MDGRVLAQAVTSCPGCSSPGRLLWSTGDKLFRTTESRFELHACTACGIRFLSPLPSAEELASYYPKSYWLGPPEGANTPAPVRARLAEAYRRAVLIDHLRFVRRVLSDQRRRGLRIRLLDVGAGDGCFAQALGASPSVSMDLSEGATRAARARGLDVVRGRLDPGGFRRGAFSLVTAFHFLEHVSPPEPYLRELRGLLIPEGDLVLQVPNLASWQASLLGRHWSGYDVPRHLVDYSERTLRSTLERAGFEVLRVSHFSLRENATTLVNSLAPGLYPPGRAARRIADRGTLGWLGDLAYLGLTLAMLPFTLVESFFGHGAAVMVQARPRELT